MYLLECHGRKDSKGERLHANTGMHVWVSTRLRVSEDSRSVLATSQKGRAKVNDLHGA